MLILADTLYLIVMLLVGPFWLVYRTVSRRPVAPLSARFFGLPSLAPAGVDQRLCWVHGVSVGEVLAARGLVSRLRDECGMDRVVISTTTRAGYDVAVQQYGKQDVFYSPFDLSFVVRRVFRALKPELLVLMELELWPNMLGVAGRRGVPVVIANGKLSLRSLRGYRRLMKVLPRFLDPIQLYCMQTDDHASRLGQLGVEPGAVCVTGSMKGDNLPEAPLSEEGRQLRAEWGVARDEVIWMAGSTHEGEESLLLRAWGRLRDGVQARLFLVPRHTSRVASVAKDVEKAGLSWVLRSELKTDSPRDAVVIVDTMGELARLFAASDVVFLGGTLVPVGGHNILEPAAEARMVVLGPHFWTIRDAATDLIEAQAARVVDDEDGLVEVMAPLLEESLLREAGGAAARKIVDGYRGASERTASAIAKQILGSPATPAGRSGASDD